jgi:DNA-binding GntR family transcriptional regulator
MHDVARLWAVDGHEHDARTKLMRIVQELRRRILIGEIPRGARLRQDELAAEFGVSITPVREALRVLESERLVVSEPHKGVRTAGVDLDRVEGIYVARRLLESFAVRRATMRMSRNDIAEQRAILEAMRGDDPAIDRRAENRRFHFAFYERAEIPELVAQIEHLWDAFPWDLLLDHPGRASTSHDEHELILRAVEQGDPLAAAAALEEHIAHSFAAIRGALVGDSTPDPFDETYPAPAGVPARSA